MKKVSLSVAIFMFLAMMFSIPAIAEVKLGQYVGPAHGTRAFCVATVALDGDVIVSALIEEFQFMDPEFIIAVLPNPQFFTNADENVLGSKRINNEYYSSNMSEAADATQDLIVSYKAIEDFVAGKTITDLESEIAGKSAEEAVDAVTSCTLVDTLGYLEAILNAAKNVR